MARELVRGELSISFRRLGDGSFDWTISDIELIGRDTTGTIWERRERFGTVAAPSVTGGTTVTQLRNAILAAAKAEVNEP